VKSGPQQKEPHQFYSTIAVDRLAKLVSPVFLPAFAETNHSLFLVLSLNAITVSYRRSEITQTSVVLQDIICIGFKISWHEQ